MHALSVDLFAYTLESFIEEQGALTSVYCIKEATHKATSKCERTAQGHQLST